MTRQEFIEILKKDFIEYVLDGETLVVSGGFYNTGGISLDDIESIPPNTLFQETGSIFLDGIKEIPEGVIFNNRGCLWLNRCEKIHSETVFNNQGYLKLRSLLNIPEGFVFNNTGNIDLKSLVYLPLVDDEKIFINKQDVQVRDSNYLLAINFFETIWKPVKSSNSGISESFFTENEKTGQDELKKIFIHKLKESDYEFEEVDGRITVNSENNVWIDGYLSIPDGTRFVGNSSVHLDFLEYLGNDILFENGGSVYLQNALEIGSGVVFRNGDDVFLSKIKSVPGNTVFENTGDIVIDYLERIPKNLLFKNTGIVYLRRSGKIGLLDLDSIFLNQNIVDTGEIFEDHNWKPIKPVKMFENWLNSF
jgi:hypothetical protein